MEEPVNQDKINLLRKLYESLEICKELKLTHEASLISMAAGCVEDDLT